MPDIDRSGWTTYAPAVCECVGVRIANINTSGGAKTVFILELVTIEGGLFLTKFFNVNKTPKGNYSVQHNSDFAKIYRTTIGENPTSRFSRANQLLKHLMGCEFIAEYIDAKTILIEHYLKATKLTSTAPIVTDEWFETGTLKAKKRSQKPKCLNVVEVTKNKQWIGNGLAKNKQKNGNELVMEKAEKAHCYLASPTISIPLTSFKHYIRPLSHIKPISVRTDDYETTIKTVTGSTSYQYSQCSNETDDEYYDRVIEESLNTWKQN
ncbi:MAG: hypothetical protein COB23_07170 [Methylophaga sp.]|nr:MAG: hypothetical protein COB23_07170 [Methylophaga sp.]